MSDGEEDGEEVWRGEEGIQLPAPMMSFKRVLGGCKDGNEGIRGRWREHHNPSRKS